MKCSATLAGRPCEKPCGHAGDHRNSTGRSIMVWRPAAPKLFGYVKFIESPVREEIAAE